MTNELIIMYAKDELAKNGTLEYTGQILNCKLPDGTVVQIPEVEPIHTYQKWKSLGYQVQKGEKAVTQIKIWKHTSKKVKNKTTGEDEEEGRMFMKVASFFKSSQVKPISA